MTTALDGRKDEELVRSAQGGDQDAFSALVRRYEGKVYHLARRIVRDEDDAQDVLQEAFLSAFRGLRNFKLESTFSTWIFRIATNAALMRLRKRRGDTISIDHRPASFDGEGEGEPMALRDWSATPDEELIDDETREVMERAIAELPPDLRTVFFLRDVEEQSNQQVAEALDLSVPAVKSRLHRARLQLRDRLHRYFQGRPARA
jgi:RNA polymerase sigma-70 factor (ECF subfamily)